ncbi:hypothetical protein, partial [Escherichia coli]|uniref:hypothetical protein n=1 Tax=Escherichia coli TaxID=562 RepID=UPI003B435C62
MFTKRHRITLLFNANKAYDRQVVEGVGEYGSDSNLLIVFYVQIMPDDLVMQL